MNKTKSNVLVKTPQIDTRYIYLDVLKLICAFLVVSIHIPFLNEFGNYFKVFARIAVPIFFMITGFFYSDTVKGDKEFKQVSKLVYLIISSNILYLIWQIFVCVYNNKSVSDYLSSLKTDTVLVEFLLFNQSKTGYHLWYLGAILYVLLIAIFFRKSGKMKWLVIISPVLLILGIGVGRYSNIFFETSNKMVLSRNFVFVGIPYFIAGYVIRKNADFIKAKLKSSFFFVSTIIFVALNFLEDDILRSNKLAAKGDYYILTFFVAVSVFLMFLLFDYNNKAEPSKLVNMVSYIGRNCTTTIYIINIIILEALNIINKNLGIEKNFRHYGAVLVFLLAVLIALAFNYIKTKEKEKKTT